ncbi:MAG: flagellar biosynthetic protein FliR [Betaproteobacteria bacterium]|nr:flagellar biosynthetic protein FliR [Betaproteobacteria bacterium]MCL2885324.1 flagellar biosynthetic protein FliR [Betaproteobacteria bacterium]
MIEISSAQIDAWIAAFIFPLARILAFVASAPLWSTAAIPQRTRLVLGLGITLAIAPALPPMPAVPPATLAGLWIMLQQMLIGIGMGFAARIVFSAFDLAGEYMGFQMGLGFATFYDPLRGSQTPVLANFFSILALLMLLSMNGHLLYFATLAQSFVAIPVSATPLAANSWMNLAQVGGYIFSSGLLLALPVTVALMITNFALAVLTRTAPQLNIFALGFPITMMGGFFALATSLRYLAEPFQAVFEIALGAMLGFAVVR